MVSRGDGMQQQRRPRGGMVKNISSETESGVTRGGFYREYRTSEGNKVREFIEGKE
jgi:hypothetical protein